MVTIALGAGAVGIRAIANELLEARCNDYTTLDIAVVDNAKLAVHQLQ